MTEAELDLLLTYENGPRVWDTAVLMPAVWKLADKGMTEPCPGRPGVYRLTAAGRAVLRQRKERHDQTGA